MNTNEPTTGEIVRALRCVVDGTECNDCRYKYPVGNVILCDHEQMNGNAADRLESQEAQIKQLAEALAYANEWHKESVENATNELRELSGISGELEAMTARAESAERERDAAIKDIRKQCETCFYYKEEETPRCSIGVNGKCYFGGYDYWKWRCIQPQDGEGK